MKKGFTKFLVTILLVCPILVGCGNKEETEQKEEHKQTESTSGIKAVTKDKLEYHNSSIETDENGTWTVITEVVNKGDAARNINNITLELKDKEGNIVDTLSSYIGVEIKPDESAATVAKTEVDLSNVKSIDYSVQ